MRTASEQLKSSVESFSRSFGLQSADMVRLDTALHELLFSLNSGAEARFGRYLSELEKVHPGIEQSILPALTDYTTREEEFMKEMLDNDDWARWIARNSAHYTDEELSVRIQNLIKNAEGKGIAMSFAPFKELPKNKELKK